MRERERERERDREMTNSMLDFSRSQFTLVSKQLSCSWHDVILLAFRYVKHNNLLSDLITPHMVVEEEDLYNMEAVCRACTIKIL